MFLCVCYPEFAISVVKSLRLLGSLHGAYTMLKLIDTDTLWISGLINVKLQTIYMPGTKSW